MLYIIGGTYGIDDEAVFIIAIGFDSAGANIASVSAADDGGIMGIATSATHGARYWYSDIKIVYSGVF